MTSKLLVPAFLSPVIPRARLLERLTEGVRGPLTLISAPAGSGKTLLVSSWVASGVAPGPVVWISLDEEDDAPGVFWSYLLAGLRRAGVDVGGIRPPERAQVVGHSVLVRLAAVLSQRAASVVLVLDNAEAVTRQQIIDGLDFLLRHAAGRLRLVIITRVDPNLPLPRYRLEGSVTEIRFAELAFTQEESLDLLTARRPDIPKSAALAFSYHARGWAAGLKLSGLPPGKGDGGGDLTGNDIAAYFRSEVLDAQPNGIRDLLLSTCVVDDLSPDLAIHLSRRAEAASTLMAMAEAGVFVDRVPGPEEVYRYHPLVQDLLRAQLRQEAPTRKRRLHRKAARWLAASGRTTEALRQLVAADDWEQACSLLVADGAIARMLAGSADAGLGALFSRFPAGTPGPAAAVVSGALAVLQGDADECDKHLSRAQELVSAAPACDIPGVALASALTAMACAATRGEPDKAVAAATRAQGMVADVGADAATTALVLFCLGRSRFANGEVAQAEGLFAGAAHSADDQEMSALRARAFAHVALVRAVSGDLDGAVRAAAGAVDGRRAPSDVPGAASDGALPPVAGIALAWVCSDRLDLEGGRSHLEAVGKSPQLFSDPLALAAETLVRSRLLRAGGDLDGALHVLTSWRDRWSACAPVWCARRMDAHEAMLLIAQGRPEVAVGRVRRHATEDAPDCLLALAWTKLCAGAAAESGRIARQVIKRPDLALDLLVDAHLLVAASAVAMSHTEAAAVAVDEAARLASAQGLCRPLQQAPPRLRALLRQQAQRRQIDTARPETSDTTAVLVPLPRPEGAGVGSPPTDGVLTQPLTEREREVLVYLDALLPTAEIAARMFVSVNTVKTHVRAILRKLSAGRRYEAVRRARELGLI
jgi:LuxR family maltose regulon positive regulatory protein